MRARAHLTFTTALILEAIASGRRYGFDIMEISGLADGTVYPALRRLERAGMLDSEWEDAEHAAADRRPPRRYYRLTEQGEELLETARRRFPALGRLPFAPAPQPEQA
jgi:DNA-binding PadR family transcriptional regulator